ncbi:Uncharacterised protein [Kingella potus]|uniref:Serine/threonine protein kinase n=1 Tax=Kingella potus TaxID=265175 RepID=A0A377R135_9NEIS|nr:DUF4102 domain-containing protein [Kingella potus]UOP01052.1 DUF4102 domain-containing protein [Kingella potus]STR00735.1 Uncharacterised protein [Kingella potus]
MNADSETPKAAHDFPAVLARLAAQQKSGIAPHTLSDGLTVWVRKAGARNPAWRYTLMGMVTRPLRLGVLKPVPNLGGEKAVATEANRLRRLAAAGIRVPELLAQQPDALLLGSLPGISLEERIGQEAKDGRLAAWEAGLDAIGEVHAKGQFLSQAFARNIMTDHGRIGFLDFEDDPSEILTLEECQSRDWLCYLHSTALLLKRHGLLERAAALWHDKLSTEPEAVRRLVVQTARPVAWMHCLTNSKWGRDVLRIAALAALFSLAAAD